jgi:Tfp pilus assembly PilM family ATPase
MHVGARRLVAAQVVWTSGRARLGAVARVGRSRPGDDLPDLDDFLRLADAMERLGFHGRRVVLVAPSEKEMVSVLELPPRDSGAPLDQIAHAEFARERRLENGSFEMAWWELPDPPRAAPGMRAMAIGVAHADVERLLEVVGEAGFDPVALDARAPALGRVVARVAGDTDGINAVLDFGWAGAGVSLMVGPTVVYHRTIPDVGLAAWQRDFMSQLKVGEDAAEVLADATGGAPGCETSAMDPSIIARARMMIAPRLEALARGVSASLTYGAHLYPGRETGKVYVVGEGARLHEARQAIGRAVALPVLCLTPECVVECGRWAGRGGDDATATLAVSLSLRVEAAS